ncbi:hypothetical protein [Proteiniclasticum ruminis]|uniref:hypothetical protein n=1 Tax=Proteiniclasticum ruminis TaxID=398199 RepID=UPI0028B013A7|nr:hypothetical protein [Proteiniclasticum ruminis]
MKWDYADMSKAAKEAGGPQEFMDGLIIRGKNKGRIEGSVATAVITVILLGGTKLILDKLSKPGKAESKMTDDFMEEHLEKIKNNPDNHSYVEESLNNNNEEDDKLNHSEEEAE